MHPGKSASRDIGSLIVPLQPINPNLTLDEVAKLFMDPRYAEMLSLPVVDDGRPIGVISRYRFSDIYLKPYARELHGKRPIRDFVNSAPLLVERGQPLMEAAQHVTENMTFPLMEDFIITDQGRYVGIGYVVGLLKAMELQMHADAGELGLAYTRLKSSQLALVQAEKMASLGQMVAGIAHEINTPLGYVQNNVAMGQEIFAQVQQMISGYESLLDSLLDEQADEAKISELMQNIVISRSDFDAGAMLGEMGGLMADTLYGIDQISELVHNLKDFSRMDAAASDSIDLNSSIESALKIGHNVIKNRLEVIRELGELPKFTCAPSQLNQVFLNLFTNAAQAMEGCGQLHIRTWCEEGVIHASVRDNGKGIPPENLARIFDPFFTTKPVGEGTGLGLAISHQIIQQHGGSIQVESRVGEGTRFHIQLPLTSPVTQAMLLAA
jgi:two-component system, NtrC family, sensor kinase